MSGVSVFGLVAALDAGPVFASEQVEIADAETSGDLLARLTPLGARLLAGVLDDFAAGRAVGVGQPEVGVSLAPKLDADDGRLDWTKPAVELSRLVRACNPSPMAWTTLGGERFRILRAVATGRNLAPGRIGIDQRQVFVGTGVDALELIEVQPQGKRPMPAQAWANGLRGEPGSFQ